MPRLASPRRHSRHLGLAWVRQCREPHLRLLAHLGLTAKHVQPIANVRSRTAGHRGGAAGTLTKVLLTSAGGEVEVAYHDSRSARDTVRVGGNSRRRKSEHQRGGKRGAVKAGHLRNSIVMSSIASVWSAGDARRGMLPAPRA
ncbi:hypothetical protein F4693_002762 [Sphingomonas endophytica]|uniref:Uncharacterized protein n=1 Tax=Sphingomonas endophytica TaxID=869719 RepID=A0A7X0JFU1_9SPHN|nr:hypothetical protein [Sphingomonas endophytica]MBB6505766.1 hypothetical protein [Sphingomonas endophytica]